MSFSVVVPIYKLHFPLFLSFLHQLLNQSVKPTEIIVACSECNNDDKLLYFLSHSPLLSSLNINYIITDTIDKCPAGINRNRGASFATNDYIMFIDADDIISPFKIEITQKIINKYHPNVFLHSFVWSKNKDYVFNNYNIDDLIIIHNKQIFDDTLLKYKHKFQPRNKYKEIINKFPSQLFISSPSNNFHICHGYITVKRSLLSSHSFTSKSRGEDGIFLRDILCNEGNIIYSPIELMNYKPSF